MSVGVPGRPDTVQIDYHPAATAEQRAAAVGVVLSFDWSDSAQQAWESALADSEAKALGASAEPIPLGVRAGLEVARVGTMDDRATLAALVASLDEARARSGLPPSGIVVPPTLTLEQCEALRQAVIDAGLVG